MVNLFDVISNDELSLIAAMTCPPENDYKPSQELTNRYPTCICRSHTRAMILDVFKFTDFGDMCSTTFQKPAIHAKTRRENEMTRECLRSENVCSYLLLYYSFHIFMYLSVCVSVCYNLYSYIIAASRTISLLHVIVRSCVLFKKKK